MRPHNENPCCSPCRPRQLFLRWECIEKRNFWRKAPGDEEMKRLLVALALLSLLGSAPARAGDTGKIIGALLGAGAGIALGDELDDVDTVVAAPVLAVAGGLLGH